MRIPVDAPIDTARTFGTPSSPDGTFWIANAGDKVVAIADGVIVSTGNDPAGPAEEGYVVQKLADGKYFAYLGLDLASISVSPQVGVAEGAPIGTVLAGFNLEGILSDSADAWLGVGNLQDPVEYLVAGGAVLAPEPAPPTVDFVETPAEEPVAVVTEPEVAPVPVETPVFPDTAEVVPSTDNWSLATINASYDVPPVATPLPTTTTNTTSGSVLNVLTSLPAPLVPAPQPAPASFDYIVTSNPSKGTPVATADPNTVEVLPIKGGIIGAVTSLPFWNDLGTRAINTFLQVGGGALGTGALGITHLSYKNALELGAAAAVLSIVTSLTRATSVRS